MLGIESESIHTIGSRVYVKWEKRIRILILFIKKTTTSESVDHYKIWEYFKKKKKKSDSRKVMRVLTIFSKKKKKSLP